MNLQKVHFSVTIVEMKYRADKLQKDGDIYWFRSVLASDDDTQTVAVLVCASQEYLADQFKITELMKLETSQFDPWVNEVTQKWANSDSRVFSQKVVYDIYANTPVGRKNVQKFLQMIQPAKDDEE